MGALPVSLALRGTPLGRWADGLGEVEKGGARWAMTNLGRVAPDEWLATCPGCGAVHHGTTGELLDLILGALNRDRVPSSVRITARRSKPIAGCVSDCCHGRQGAVG